MKKMKKKINEKGKKLKKEKKETNQKKLSPHASISTMCLFLPSSTPTQPQFQLQLG